jgi:hypothetical protein
MEIHEIWYGQYTASHYSDILQSDTIVMDAQSHEVGY